MEYWTILLSIIFSVFSIYYLFINFNVFKRHNIIHIPSVPIFGSMIPIVFRQESLDDFFMKIYNFNPDAKYIGFHVLTVPTFLLRDLKLVKSILIKNFKAFPDRGNFSEFKDPLFEKNLFSLHGEEWRNVRTLLSPSFTPSKIKMMFTLMSECAEDFVKFLLTLPKDKGETDMKDAFSKYTIDVIATCTFGIKIDSTRDPTNKFYVYGKESTNFLRGRSLKFVFLQSFPNLGRFLNIKLINDCITKFFKNIVKTIIATRDAEHITRPDMLQLMMDIKGKEGCRELNIDDMAAQVFAFFFNSFEGISKAMSFAAHEIAANPEVQTKLQQEIDKVLEKSNGKVSYESINRLKYLDAVISETLRLYPSVPFIERVCDESYELPPVLPGEKPFVMKKGMSLLIPIYAIHRDKKYYDNPERFDPERFLNNKMRHNCSYYMPFGIGPRMCIANRFVLLEFKVLLFHLLARCELKLCAKTTSPIKFSKNLVMWPENGFWLNIQHRKDMRLFKVHMNGVSAK